MTPPRYIVENQLCFVTCDAISRSFRFLPTRKVVDLLWYLLAVMTERWRIEVHEVLFMSNHWHVVLTDRGGVLPDFMRDFNSLLSRGLNALRGSTGANVESGYNIVNPTDEERVVEHAVYTLTNPCKADLVKRAEHWEGVSSLELEYGEAVTYQRPRSGLWSAVVESTEPKRNDKASASSGRRRHAGRTKLPESVAFALVRPPVMLEHNDAELRAIIRAGVRRAEDEFEGKRREKRRDVLGMRRVLAQSYTDTPNTSRALFKTTPRVSGRTWARVEGLGRRLDFEHAHARARDAIAEVLTQARALGRHLAARLAAIALPKGAFLLRRRYGCVCVTTI